ncbi:MAG: SGNH/GDSL hydrolase family protein [Undibacterium sp.]|nr:SGNH/GDSL hydrolase family protein [Opitutaceae bacterium]
MLTRREFLRHTALGSAALLAAPRLRAAPADSALARLRARLVTAESLGTPYLRDSLRLDAPSPAALTVQTHLADPAHSGRRREGWTVRGGLPAAYTWVTLRDAPMLGTRTQWAQLSSRSTQTGVAPDRHGLVEMRLCRGTTSDDVPVRVRLEDGCFYILSLNSDTVLAGDRTTPLCPLVPGADYTLGVLLFAKAIYARLAGPGLPGGAVELVVPDRRRFIPGRPGFGLRPAASATGGELLVFDWQVTPVGPAPPCRLGLIGDSITAGNDQEPEGESYAHLVTRALGQDLVLNTGSGGSTAMLDLARLPYEIAPFRPRLLWIEGGSNDLAAGVGAEEVFKNIMRQAELVRWDGRAVLSTLVPRAPLTAPAKAQLVQLNRLIRESGRPFVDRHALVCDPADTSRLRPEFAQPDGVHLTLLGHALIARDATRLFRSLLP